MHHLTKYYFSIRQLKEVFSGANKISATEEKDLVNKILNIYVIELPCELVSNVPEALANLLFYVAGGFARNICNQFKCLSCKELFITNEEINHQQEASFKEFFSGVNIGTSTRKQ